MVQFILVPIRRRRKRRRRKRRVKRSKEDERARAALDLTHLRRSLASFKVLVSHSIARASFGPHFMLCVYAFSLPLIKMCILFETYYLREIQVEN
jgi:hypothetical protein